MRVPALMAAICLATLSACAQPAPGYGDNGPPPGYGQGPPPGYAQNAPPQSPPGYGGGWAGGMQGAGGQDQGPPPSGGYAGGSQPGYGAPPAAPAQGGGHGGGFRARFDAANVTHDGRLTQQQAQDAGMREVARHFSEIDRDQKGYVTTQDIHAWKHERHAARAQAGQASQGYPPPAPAGGYGQQPPSGQQY